MEAVRESPAAQSPSWPEFGEDPEGWEGGAGAAVACEAVEFEDLFANPIAEGANLEFRVSRVTEGEEDVEEEEEAMMDVDGTVFERLAKSEIVMEDEVAEEVTKAEKLPEVEDVESDAAVALNRLESQAKLVNSHVDELQRIVSLQSSLTGANPLAQELASAVLGTKEGKVGDSLSSGTLKYLHSVFAVKDTLTKKEARELCLISGATLTQVRDFFAMQRSRVRSMVEQFTDEAELRSDEIADEQLDEILAKDVGFSKLTDVDSVESLLEKMRQEKLLTEQEKLLRVILRTEQGLILRRFLEKGGLKVLCTWLIAAAADKQTTLLRQLLHVLSHLPMGCAIPLQVSSLLQPVNKLRFYFIQDVANHARILMSKWSNLFMNKVEGVTSVDSENLDVSRRVQKRGRDPSVTIRRYEGVLPKTKPAESVKGQFDLARTSVRPVSSGGIMKVPVFALAASKAAGGHIAKSSTVSEDSPPYNTSKMKAVAAMQRNFRKVVPSKGARQPQTSIKSRLPETGAMDESADNQALSGGARNPLSGLSSSSTLTSSQAPQAGGASTMDGGSKVKGAAKVAAAMSTIRSSSTFPVSEAANFATPVSRKHSLVDQQKERRRVLPVEELGNGNRWRESTARRPVIEVGKTSRPLSADEIRKAKLRARIMQTPTAGISNHKYLGAQEPFNSRGKPTPVGDGWSLDRYATMDGGDRSSQDGGGASLPRPMTSNVDTTSVPRQILDEKTFDQLVAEEAAESKADGAQAAKAKASGLERGINTGRSLVHGNTLEQGAESIGQLNETSLPEGDSIPDFYTGFQQDTAIDVDSQPLSPSIVVALCENVSETETEVAENIGGMNDPVCVSPEDPVVDIIVDDSVMEQASVESACADVIPSEPVNDQVIEAYLIPWVVPPVLNLNSGWGVVAGDTSKELGFQAARVKREEEEIYSDLLSIPDNPKDLWDEEPLYDDTLTPEIPIEVLEISSSKASSPTAAVVNQVVDYNPLTSSTLPPAKILGEAPVASTKTYGGAQQIGDAGSGHDPNLLALLLSNPHLVSQLASQQKGDGSLAGLSALLALGNVASQSAPTQAQVLGQPTSNSNVSVQLLQLPHAKQMPGAMQPRDQVANTGNFQVGQALPTPLFPETNAGSEASGAVVPPAPSWDGASSWALPTPPAPPPPPPPPSLPSQGSSSTSVPPPPPPPPPLPLEFVSVGYNGSFQKSQQAYTWAPLNTVMHASPKAFDPSQGRGRLPVMSHNVNGAADVVDDAAAPPPVFATWSSSNAASLHQPVNHHNVVTTWAHSEAPPDYQQQHHQRWVRPPPSSSSSSLPTPPLPPYPPQQPLHSQPPYWQPSPSPFRQDCRPHHQSAPQWHPSGPNYGHNPR